MKKHKVDVRSELPAVGRRLDIALLRRAVRLSLDAERADMPCRVSVLVTDDEGIRALNWIFRKKDAATDVLSFPMLELTPGAFRPDPTQLERDTGLLMLGDIVLSYDRIRAQAYEFGQSPDREMAYLAVHSVLHLLGYDHQDEGPQKRRMRAREEAILQLLYPEKA